MSIDWENIKMSSEDERQDSSPIRTNKSEIREQNERKRLTQLQKLQSHKNSHEQRGEFIVTMTKFGELLINDKKEEMTTLLTEECEIFLFNFAEASLVEFGYKHEGFAKIFQDYQIIERDVRYNLVDLEQTTGFQLSHWTIKKEKDGSTISQYSFEVFSFENGKICKYRVGFGTMVSLTEAESVFKPSPKERMLAKVKELNYAFTDQPDLEKIASLLNENTEYKIWRWKDKKCFAFDHKNFASEFRKSLEEDYEIKSIVPFDPTVEAQYVLGSYVFYLEGKGELTGKRFQWISTCIFAFDKDASFSKIRQQGELYEEDEMLIPFEVYSREKIKQLVHANYDKSDPKDALNIFNNQDSNFSAELELFSYSFSPQTGVIKGFSDYKKLTKLYSAITEDFEKSMPVDIYLSCDDLCYDTAITMDYGKGIAHVEGNPFDGKPISTFSMIKYSFENGKVAKVLVFALSFLKPIPSPFDDTNFINLNLKPKHEYFSQ